MGFRFRRSMKIAPGVRLNFSKSGLGLSLGPKGARASLMAGGRVRRTLSVPGTGVSWVTETGKRRARAKPRTVERPAPAPKRPGLFAPRGEKALYRALVANDREALREVSEKYPEYRPAALAIGWRLWQHDHPDRTHAMLAELWEARTSPIEEPFFRKYLSARVSVHITAGVTADMPMDRDAIGLLLAESYQAAERIDDGIKVVEGLPRSTHAVVSLAELYALAGRPDDVIRITEGVENTDDGTAFAWIMRAKAFREKGLFDAALECLREARRSKARSALVLHRALYERGLTYEAQGKLGLARRDLERILAEDSDYDGVRESLARLGH